MILSATKAASAGPAQRTIPRPPVDWWEAAGERYSSTADLVASFQPSPEGSNGEYHWRDRAALGLKDVCLAALPAVAKGAGLGAVAGAALSGFINVAAFLMALDHVAHPFGLSEFLSIPKWALGGLLVGSGVSATSAIRTARTEFARGNVVPGVLLDEPDDAGSRLCFYVGGHIQKGVDLNEYAQAQPGPIPVGTTPWWLSGVVR